MFNSINDLYNFEVLILKNQHDVLDSYVFNTYQRALKIIATYPKTKDIRFVINPIKKVTT